MDEKRTTQALKQIFDLYGTSIIKDQRRFEAHLEDLLPSDACASERRLLRYALDSNALPVLLRQSAFTEGSARQAVNMLQNDSYVSEEAAQFVVRCVIAARGGEARLANKPAPKQTAPTPPKTAPVPSTPAPLSPPGSTTAPVPSQPTAPRPNPPAPTVLCTLWCAPIKPKSKDIQIANKRQQPGEVQMLPDRLIFTPSFARERTEIAYHDIAKIEMESKAQHSTRMLKRSGWLGMLYVIALGGYSILTSWKMGVTMAACAIGMFVLAIIVGVATWNRTGTDQIGIQAGKQQYVFKIKNQRQSEQMYATLQQGIHQYP